MAKFKGVSSDAERVAAAVKLTESATFALESDDIKFEIFPPGHAAIRIIPMATDAGGRNRITSKKVSAGRITNCAPNPKMNDFGNERMFLKCCTLISNATPNMMAARVTFINSNPPSLKFNLTESIPFSSSYMVIFFEKYKKVSLRKHQFKK